MKTLAKNISLTITLSVLFSLGFTASVFNFTEETYINDIPFNTECVTSDCLYQQAVSIDFQLEDDNYIDDIPFDTECISSDCLYKKAMLEDFNLGEEAYIDDIEL